MPESRASENNRSVFIPLAIGLVAVLVWIGFQTIQLAREHINLRQVYGSQESPLQTAQKMRTQMDAIASGTAKLAAKGNADAKMIMDALSARGITIDPDAHTPPPPQ